MSAQSFQFKTSKALQAVAVLLDTERSRQMAYYRLLKLLYIADREYLQETGRPIVGGRAVAMDRGPLSSAVYDLVKKVHQDYPIWSKFFRTEGRTIEMLAHPGNDELSKREIRKLLEVIETLGDRDDEELGIMTHGFAEYRKNYQEGTSTPIPLTDILEALGLTKDADAILGEARELAAIDRVFGD